MSEEHDISNILVVDSSKLARVLTSKTLKAINPEHKVLMASTIAEAMELLNTKTVDLLITSFVLSDGDGVSLCQHVRKNHRYIPVLVISGDVDDRLQKRMISADVTDYLDKSKGQSGLKYFIEGILTPKQDVNGHILYVEDSKVVAHATKKILQNHGLTTDHTLTISDAISYLEDKPKSIAKYDLILTDYYLKDNETAQGLIEYVRGELEINKQDLPFVVMTGDENLENQRKILKSGANDLVSKPVNQESLMKKIQFQIQFKKFQSPKSE